MLFCFVLRGGGDLFYFFFKLSLFFPVLPDKVKVGADLVRLSWCLRLLPWGKAEEWQIFAWTRTEDLAADSPLDHPLLHLKEGHIGLHQWVLR